MPKFTEAELEQSIIDLLGEQGYPHVIGSDIDRGAKGIEEVLIKDDLRAFLSKQYAGNNITGTEIDAIIRQLDNYSAADLYASNKAIMAMLQDGFQPEREDRNEKDFRAYLIDYDNVDNNIFKLVNQLTIQGNENKRIPDAILYVNGLPLVVFEFKSTTRENVDCYEAYQQVTQRYRQDIPELFKYNALCVISDGVNTKSGSFFAGYGFFYAWRKITGNETVEKEGIKSLYSMIQGLFNKARLLDVIHHFNYMPDTGNDEVKILCRYPQYYATRKLLENIKRHIKTPSSSDDEGDNQERDGKGGTYFGTTGCGKSFTMLFLSRLIMKSTEFASPTIVLITDRTDLDDQLSETFGKAKGYIGDDTITSVQSRAQLRELLKGRESGGVFLTTIHKFTEDIELLTDRSNVVCISDEAHRSQTNLDQKVTVVGNEVRKTYGFAKYLHDSLPNATYVGFTGTPVDATLDVFGEVVDSYTMIESVNDKITVPIVYEGRAAKVILDNAKLNEIEGYYAQCVREGASEYQVEESKKASATMVSILGDPDRLHALAKDFVAHYENRIVEGSSVKGKAMFVSSSRQVAYDFYKELIDLRPEWAEVKKPDFSNSTLSQKKRDEIKPMERVKLIMTRGKDDDKALYEMLGNKEYRKSLDTQFKKAESNFKIAIVVDMWLTGFDVPFLDTIYIDKPLQKHNLIQTISRVNRNFEDGNLTKTKGLVVDYIGIKNQMNQALAMYSKTDASNIEDIEQSLVVVKDHLDLLKRLMHRFDSTGSFSGTPVQRLECLNMAADFVLDTEKQKQRFMDLVKRLKAAYDICSGSDELSELERDHVHFYLAIRSIIYKLTKGNAPDAAQMNLRVREMVKEALQSDGVEEVFKLGDDAESQVDIFKDDYLEKIAGIKLPNTRIMLLQQLLAKAIGELKKVNKVKGVDFTQKFQTLVNRYNEREDSTLIEDVCEDLTEGLLDLMGSIKTEIGSNEELDISFEEKAFYDILKLLAHKHNFEYAENKLIELSKAVKVLVDNKTKYTDWSQRGQIRSELKMDLIVLLADHGYPPVDREEVFQEVFEQAETYKKHRG